MSAAPGAPRAWTRWLATLGVAALVAAGCVTAGVWQWQRYQQRSAAVAVLLANGDAPALPVADVLGDDVVAPGEVWRSVTVLGEYLPGSTVLLRNRPVQGQAGLHALAAFRVTEGGLAGAVLVVDRGFVPDARSGDVPAPPSGRLELVGRVRVAEATTTRDAPPGQVQAIAPEQARAAAPTPWQGTTSDAYLTVVSENGAAPADLAPLERPSTDLGPNLSYAFQWWVFAAGAIVGAVLLLRRDARGEQEVPGATPPSAPSDGADGRRSGAGGGPGRRARRRTAEDEEDSLLDAQESAARAAATSAAARDGRPT
jgi:cytochrome oxidase assembly protein ShyY1